METRWSLKLEDKAAAAAKRIKREVSALNAAMRELKDAAGLADRALNSLGGGATARNLRTQIGLTRELGRELRRTNGESRRASRPRSPGYGPTRQEGMFTPAESARLRAMEDRRRARDTREQSRRDIGAGRAMSKAMQQSFRENEQLRLSAQRSEAQRERARVRQNARMDASPLTSALEGLVGRGGIAAFGYAAAGAAALMGAIYALGSAMVSITRTTFEIAGQIAGLVVEFGQLALSLGGAVLQMISFRESTLMTLSTLMRVAGEDRMTAQQRQTARGAAAQDEFRWAQQFGRETPLSTQQVVELRTQAATAGYQGAEARTMTAAAADAGALHPQDASTASRFMLQMGQLRNSSVARSADYRPAAQAAGVSEVAAMRRAAIAAGVVQRNGETEPAYQRRIRTAQGNGQITGRQMHDAILAEQRAQLGSRNSGDFARSQSGSIAAVLSNLREGAQAFVTSIQDIERLPGIVALKAMLTQIADTLAGTTRNGKDLQALFANLVNTSAGFVGTIFGEGGFDGALASAMATAKDFLPLLAQLAGELRTGFMEGIAPMLSGVKSAGGLVGGLRGVIASIIPDAREFARGLGTIAVFMLRITRATVQAVAALISAGRFLPDLEAGLRGAANPLAMIIEAFNSLRAGAGTAINGSIRDALLPPGTRRRAIADWLGIGQDMGRGVAAGFRSQQAFMQSEVSSVMNSLPAQARTDMQIKSPSRVMAEIGRYMAEGVAVGLDSGAGGVQSAMSNVVAPPGLPGFGGGALGGLGGGAPISIGPFTIQIDGAQDSRGIADDLQSKMEEIFVGIFDRARLAGGF